MFKTTALRRMCAIGAALAAAMVVSPAQAAVPGTMLLEGVLLSSGGGPAADGKYSVTVGLYGAKTGGSALHSAKHSIDLKAGRFSIVLGSGTKLDPAKLKGAAQLWMGLKVGTDPELPRSAMHSVMFAQRAQVANGVECSGCISGGAVAKGSLGPASVNFAYAAAADGIKGGDAKVARALKCTGCVSVAHLKFDKDVDLQGRALKAGKITASGDVVAGGIIAGKQFVGDGSKLTGIKTPAGSCTKAGEVVKGINADGSLKCVQAMDPKALPADGIDEISNGLIANQFVDEIQGAKAMKLRDNNPEGTYATINFPDIGVAQDISVNLNLTNSDTSQLSIFLFPPNAPVLPSKKSTLLTNYPVDPRVDGKKYPHYVLHAKKKAFDPKDKTKLVATFPKPHATVAGDIHKDWIGKNIKGEWRLFIVDSGYKTNQTDGQLNSWSIKIQTLSNKKVQVNGRLISHGDIKFGNSKLACNAVSKGSIRWNVTSNHFEGCDGTSWQGLSSALGTTKKNPGKTCWDIKKRNPAATDGYYWLDPDGVGKGIETFFAYCDQTRDGGGWMLGIKTWYRDHFFSWIGGGRAGQWGDIRTAPFSVKDYSFKMSDTQIKALIGAKKNFDVLWDQAGLNSSYTYRNIEYVVMRNYTADWRFTGKVAASSTPVTVESWHYDGTLLWQGKGGTNSEPKCGHVGGWGINCYGTKTQNSSHGPDGGKRCKRWESRKNWTGHMHLYMSNTNTDSYIYMCNGAQHSSGHHLAHRYWFRERN